MSELKATTAQEIVRNEKDCDYMDELFGGVKMPPTQVYLKPEDLIIDNGENVDEDECRHVVGIADNSSNCPANGKCSHDFWTDCGEAFMEWALEETEDACNE